MQMIGHETVRGAEKVFARGGVEHQFPERGVKRGREPAARAFFKRVRPEDDRVALVMMSFQPGKFPFAGRGHKAGMEVVRKDVKCGFVAGLVATEVTRWILFSPIVTTDRVAAELMRRIPFPLALRLLTS